MVVEGGGMSFVLAVSVGSVAVVSIGSWGGSGVDLRGEIGLEGGDIDRMRQTLWRGNWGRVGYRFK